VCISKEYGGLGVRQLREFNTVFIRKMCWRLLVNKPGLWYRVVVARYGESEERVRLGGRGASSWWREILRLREGSGEGEGGVSWRGWKGRLVVGGAAWVWELISVLPNFVLQPNVAGQWVWRHDPGGGYSVRGAYEIVTAQDTQHTVATSYLIWHK
jgi:hypothetical protein